MFTKMTPVVVCVSVAVVLFGWVCGCRPKLLIDFSLRFFSSATNSDVFSTFTANANLF